MNAIYFQNTLHLTNKLFVARVFSSNHANPWNPHIPKNKPIISIYVFASPPWSRELSKPRVLCNMRYPSETHLKLQSREVSFAYHLFGNCLIVLKYCTEHGSDTAVLCATFQNDWAGTGTDVMDRRDFARVEFKMCFGRISHFLYCKAHSMSHKKCAQLYRASF